MNKADLPVAMQAMLAGTAGACSEPRHSGHGSQPVWLRHVFTDTAVLGNTASSLRGRVSSSQ